MAELTKKEINHQKRKLMLAARDGLTDKIESLLDEGVYVNSRCDIYHNAIIQAASNNQLDAVDLLLRRGANVDSVDNMHNTPLICTSSLEVYKRLFKAGSNINHRNRMLNTPLFCHAFKGNTLIIKELILSGVPLENKNADGDTALLRAAKVGSIDAVQTLLELGADHTAVTSTGKSIFDIASESENPQLEKLVRSFLDKQSLESVIGKDADCADGMVF